MTTCSQCTFANEQGAKACEMCGHPMPVAGCWTCDACTYAGNAGSECEMCGSAKPAAKAPPPAAAARGAPAVGGGGGVVAELVEMGFSTDRAQAAIEATGSSVEEALGWLLAGWVGLRR